MTSDVNSFKALAGASAQGTASPEFVDNGRGRGDPAQSLQLITML
jgi:hypothetical protein